MILSLLLALGSSSAPPASALPGPAIHVGSYSLSEIHVRVSRVQVQLRCQVLSLGEVIEPFDPDLDGSLEGDELAENEDAIIAYVSEHYSVVAGAASDAEASDKSQALKLLSATVTEAPLALDPLAEISEWVDVVLDYEVPSLDRFDSLGVHIDLFYDTSPQHQDSTAVVWNGIELGAWQFMAGADANVFQPTDEMLSRNAPAVQRYFAQGAGRARGALDAALLVLLLVCGARAASRGSAALSAALFLGLMVLGAVGAGWVKLLPEHVRFLELTIPLALAYVGLDDLLHGRGRTRILEPTVFGLILGGREATRLAPDLAREASPAEPLVGFGLGLAAALGAVAVVAILLLRMPPRTESASEKGGDKEDEAGDEGGATAPIAFSYRALRIVLDSVAIVLGLMLFWRVYSGA